MDGMAPKNNYDSTNTNSKEVDEADLQEMADVNNSLDELSTALDCFEERTDNILQQLRELLDSNREIRKELAMQKAAAAAAGDGVAEVPQQQQASTATATNDVDAADSDAME